MSNITLEPIDITDPYSVYGRMRSFYIETTHMVSISTLYHLRDNNFTNMKNLVDTLSQLKTMGRISFTKNNLFALENFDKPGKFRFVKLNSYLNRQQCRMKRIRTQIIKYLTEEQRLVHNVILFYIMANGYYPAVEEVVGKTSLPQKTVISLIEELSGMSLIDKPCGLQETLAQQNDDITQYIHVPPNQQFLTPVLDREGGRIIGVVY